MRRLKLAIIGCGAIVENNHLPALSRCPEWQIACLVDPFRERVEQLARRYHCLPLTDLSQVPAGIDAVLVAVPNALHGEVSRHFLRQGCHVLCEKPLTIGSAEGQALFELSRNQERLLVVGHQLRFLPPVQSLRGLVEGGRLGRLRSIVLSMGWASEWASVSNFYRDRTQAGGGVMLDLGCHLFDLADYLCGEADSARCLGVDFGDTGGTLEKALSAELTFPSGLQGLVGASRLTNLANVITVTGDAGWASASLDGEDLTLSLSAAPLCATGAARTRLPPVEPFRAMWHRFAGAVSRGWLEPDDGLCDAEAGIRAVRLVESLYREIGL